MQFNATVETGEDGDFIASCEDPACVGHGLSPANALDALRDEIRYRIELCPCTTVGEDFVELNVVSGM